MIGGTILWNNTADRYDPPYPNPTGYVKTELDLFNLLKTEEGIRPSQDLIIKNRSIDFIGNTYVDGKGKRISLLLACKRIWPLPHPMSEIEFTLSKFKFDFFRILRKFFHLNSLSSI